METVNVGKKLVDNLIEEYNQNIKETRLVEKASAENENNQKCSSCTLYIVLFSIFFTTSIGIAVYFAYFYRYLKKEIPCVVLNTRAQTTI